MTKNKLSLLIDKRQSTWTEVPRNYIGASVIGADCLRQIWYEHRGEKAEGIPPKIRRTWELGRNIEGLVLDWLEDAGITIVRQWGNLEALDTPYFKGHVDSVWVDKKGKPKAIIEIKTAKDASFKIFAKKGVKEWNPQYYAQIQAYMGMSGIFSTYLLAINKDNSDLFDELVLFDDDFYAGLVRKAKMISLATSPPPRINGSPLYFKCKLCKYNKVCYK